MPIITVYLIEGYDSSLRSKLASQLSDTARAVTGADADGVSVVINEVAADNYMRGGQHRQPGSPPPAAKDLVQDYLSAMENRDLDHARSFLSPEFTMTFPGNHQFRELEQLIAWAKNRYQSVNKTYQQFDESVGSDGTVVYCFGTLQGAWPDGSTFSDIRFIDRFLVVDGKLRDQKVWNDLGETVLNAGN